MNYIVSNISMYIEFVYIFFENHPTLSSLFFGGGAGGIVASYLQTRSQIKINTEAEKIKYEMKRQYMYTEIKTKNLVEIYPRLNLLALQAAWMLPGIINLIKKKIDSDNLEENELKEKIKLYFASFFEQKNRIESFRNFSNFLLENAVFISLDVYKHGDELKVLIGQLREIVIEKIGKVDITKYSKNECILLINTLFNIVKELDETKELFMKQINKELRPY